MAKPDVLANAKDVMQRKNDLIAAMAYTNTEHDKVGIILQLANFNVVKQDGIFGAHVKPEKF